MHITEVLKDGMSVSDVLRNLKKREEKFLNGMTFAERGAIIRKLFPQVCETRIKQADNSLEGRMILPGCSSLHFIGDPVKWHENIFDYDEYTYQLNRMDHWRFLAEAYSYTGDRRYAEKKSSGNSTTGSTTALPSCSTAPTANWQSKILTAVHATRESGALLKWESACIEPGRGSSII